MDPGNKTWTLSATPKVVAGIDDASLAAVQEFYGKLVADVVPVSSPRAAEMTKLLENTFRHVNIALVNEFAIFARELGIDVWEVCARRIHQAVRLHAVSPWPRCGRPLPADRPDLPVLARPAGNRDGGSASSSWPTTSTTRCRTMWSSGSSQGLNRLGRPVLGSRVLLWAWLTRRTPQTRGSRQPVRSLHLLASLGAQVSAVDGHVPADCLAAEATRVTPHCRTSCAAADAVVVLTDHDGVDYDFVEREARWVLDCRQPAVWSEDREPVTGHLRGRGIDPCAALPGRSMPLPKRAAAQGQHAQRYATAPRPRP